MANPLKILGVIDEDPFHCRTWSGSSLYFFRALQEKHVLYNAISAQPPMLSQWVHKLRSANLDVAKWRFKYHLNTRYFDIMTKTALKRLSELAQHAYNVILQVGAWYDLTKRPDRLTVSYHDGNLHTRLTSPYGHPEIPAKFIKEALNYEKQLYHKMDHIFTMSRWLADSFVREFHVSPSKITPVGAGVNLPYLKQIKDKCYAEPKILFVGHDFKRKGGLQLLEAFRIVRDAIKHTSLTIIGPRLSGTPDKVTCYDYISKHTDDGLELLLNQYSSASIFVMPSLYEPFGIAFAEAMAHKLPCIGTNVCAIPEIIDHGHNGYLVRPGDSLSLAKRIIELLEDPQLCREMGEKGYRKYEQNYTWSRVADRMIERIRTDMIK